MTFFTKTIKTLLLVLVTVQLTNAQIYSQDFESGQPAEWTFGENWTYGDAATIASTYFNTPEHTFFMAINDDALTSAVNDYTSLAYSESIDLTSATDAFFSFSVFYLDSDFYGADETAKVYISNDAGATWTEVLDVQGDENGWQNIVLDISEYAGELIHVGFEYSDANEWNSGFAFDDVVVDDQNPGLTVDLRANSNWFSVASNLVTPVDQEDTFYPMSDFQNVGIEDQEGVVLSINIEDGSGQNVFSDNIEFGTLMVDSLAENQFFQSFVPTTTGVYKGTYSIAGDNVDLDPSNNETVFNFVVSDSTFANDFVIEDQILELDFDIEYSGFYFNAQNIFADNPDVIRQWGTGNIFQVTKGTDNYVRYITAAIQAEAGSAGQTITFSIYKWDDANADNTANTDEVVPAGIMAYTVEGTENGIYTLPFEDLLTNQPVQLEDNATYILMFEYLNETTNDNSDVAVYLSDFGSLYFYGTQFANSENSELDMNSVFIFAEDNTGILNKDLVPFSTNGLQYSPMIRMSVGEALEIDTKTTQLSLNNETSIFPLPAADFVNLQMSFEEIMTDVEVSVMNEAGKVIATMNYSDVKDQTIEFNTSNLASGVYFFNIATEKGSRAEMFIVQN
jgi:hypothetical protein